MSPHLAKPVPEAVLYYEALHFPRQKACGLGKSEKMEKLAKKNGNV